MSTETLFGFLAHRFVAQRENLATEALSFLLERSPAARSAVIRLIRSVGGELPDDLGFRTQASANDQAIPDLVGEDDQGRQVLIAEAKFWAGLTDAQPVVYLRRFEVVGHGVLLVIAPAARLELLWNELVRRCEEAQFQVSDCPSVGREIRSAAVHPGGQLVTLSWRVLLSAVSTSLEIAQEYRLLADLAQLQGLCEHEDAEAFLPLGSEELTGTTARRLLQFNQLVDDAYGILARKGVVDGSGLRSSAGGGWYGRYCRIQGFPCLLQVSAWVWARYASTPLWLRVAGADWRSQAPEVGRALQKNGLQIGVDVFPWPDGHGIPIFLPIGVERDAVLRAVVEQVQRIADILLDAGALPDHSVGPLQPEGDTYPLSPS